MDRGNKPKQETPSFVIQDVVETEIKQEIKAELSDVKMTYDDEML
jgi:hypothetical protein